MPVQLTKAPPPPLARRLRSLVTQCRVRLYQGIYYVIAGAMHVLVFADKMAKYILPAEYRFDVPDDEQP